jgi:hypothetical protein
VSKTPESVKRPCPACKLGKVLRPSFVDGSKDTERTCSVCRGIGWLYVSKEEMVEMIVRLQAEVRRLTAANTKEVMLHAVTKFERDAAWPPKQKDAK